MLEYQRQFIEFALQCDVLRFGEFTLKSGRVSPYFFNAGLFNSGQSLAKLSGYYAQALIHGDIEFDMLYGAAYKGIPLVAATCVCLAREHDRDVPFAFNRKEAKDHGEKGNLVGAPLEGRVIMLDDVISAGTSTRESVQIIREAAAQPVGVLVALDRQERGQGHTSALEEAREELGLQAMSIINLAILLQFLEQTSPNSAALVDMRNYRDAYGSG